MGGSHSSSETGHHNNNNNNSGNGGAQQHHHHHRMGGLFGAFGGGACGLFTSSLPLETTELHDLLISACRTGDFQVVQEIAMRNIIQTNDSIEMPSSSSSVEQLQKMKAQPALLNQPSRLPEDKGDSPLHICVRFQQDECIEVLLEAGIDVLTRNNDFQIPLHLAVSTSGNRRKFVKMLLQEPLYESAEDDNENDNKGEAEDLAKKRKKLMFQMIMPRPSAKEQLGAQDAQGNTALHLAVLNGKAKAFDYMLRFHPDLNIKNYDGYNIPSLIASLAKPHLRTSADIATVVVSKAIPEPRPSPHFYTIDSLYQMANSIFHNAATETFSGVRLQSTNNEGFTALHLALQNEDLYLSSLLLAGGADVNATSKHGETALHIACSSGNPLSVLQILRAKKKDSDEPVCVLVDTRDINGNTPLHQLLASLSSEKSKDDDILECVNTLITQSPSLLKQRNLDNISPQEILMENKSISDRVKAELMSSFAMEAGGRRIAICVLSDFHLESKTDSSYHDLSRLTDALKEESAKAKYLVVFGGAASVDNQSFKELLKSMSCCFDRVLLLLGPSASESTAQEQKKENEKIVILNRATFDIEEDVRLIGCTLWPDLSRGDLLSIRIQENGNTLNMCDWKETFALIDSAVKIEKPSGADQSTICAVDGWRKQEMEWLESQLKRAQTEQKRAVIITHFSPITRLGCGNPDDWDKETYLKLSQNVLSHYSQYHIDTWLYSHYHWFHDITINETRVFCNPRGYPTEKLPLRVSSIIQLPWL